MSFFKTRRVTPENDPTVALIPQGPGWRQFFITGAVLVGILWLCVHFAGILIDSTNQNPSAQDQKLNINRAIQVKPLLKSNPEASMSERLAQWWPHDTDGVVGPLWSWTAAHFVKDGHELQDPEVSEADRDLFRRGKWVNVTICVVFLWALGLVAAKTFSPAASVTMLLLAAFAALLPRAVYFQPEPLYFISFFLAWVCALKLLLDNHIWLHGVFGALAGMAYLAKTSVEPLLLAWFGIAGLRFAWAVCRKPDFHSERRWLPVRHFFGLIALAIGWLLVVGPRYQFSSEKFGDVRHSYPAYWIWFDDFDKDAHPWRHVYKDKETLSKLEEGTRPSLKTYLEGLPLMDGRTQPAHTWTQFWERLRDGTAKKTEELFAPSARGKKKEDGSPGGWKHLLPMRGIYLGGVAMMTAFAACVFWFKRKAENRFWMHAPDGAFAVSLFVVGTFAGYALLYGFYHQIGRGDRFMLSLYLPLVFSLLWAGEGAVTLAQSRGAKRWVYHVWQGGLWLVSAAILWRLIEVLLNPVFDAGTT